MAVGRRGRLKVKGLRRRGTAIMNDEFCVNRQQYRMLTILNEKRREIPETGFG
jgi:hypothetical protein